MEEGNGEGPVNRHVLMATPSEMDGWVGSGGGLRNPGADTHEEQARHSAHTDSAANQTCCSTWHHYYLTLLTLVSAFFFFFGQNV